jgi:chromosome partitioning protein
MVLFSKRPKRVMRLAISNQKGGAGKTTTAINVAGALNQHGQDVLVIDLDPQGHATEGLGHGDLYEANRLSLIDVLTDLDALDRLDELVVNHTEMDLVPSHERMINAEDKLAAERAREQRLQRLLDGSATDGYDHILIDCPPNLGILTDNAIAATQNVLIPAQAKTTSKRAIKILFKQLASMEAAFGDIDEIALVANEVGHDGEASEMMEWFKEIFENRENKPVFEIRKRVKLQRAWNAGVSIFEHSEECDMESEYLAIAEHIEEVADD